MDEREASWEALHRHHRATLARADWRSVIDDGEARGSMAFDERGPALLRCDTELGCNPSDLARFLVTDILQTLPQWNPVFDGGEVLEELGDGERVLRLVNRLPWPMRRREDVFFNACKPVEDGSIVEVSAGVEHRGAPLRSDMIRSGLLFASKQMTPIAASGSRLIIVWHYDLRGVLGRVRPRSLMGKAMLKDMFGECCRLRKRYGPPA